MDNIKLKNDDYDDKVLNNSVSGVEKNSDYHGHDEIKDSAADDLNGEEIMERESDYTDESSPDLEETVKPPESMHVVQDDEDYKVKDNAVLERENDEYIEEYEEHDDEKNHVIDS